MKYIVSASTDIGNVKKTNQDSLNVKQMTVNGKQIVLAVLCDGVGGLQKGEVASTSLVVAFGNWAIDRIPELAKCDITEDIIRQEWTALIEQYNEKIKTYGQSCGASLGTTITAILLTDDNYFTVNVGDSRIYEIQTEVRVITNDQTVVEREIALGNLTREQAKMDPRKNILLQCVGVSDVVYPEFIAGETKKNAVYMLCSDGFRHEITPDEIYTYLRPDNMMTAEKMKENELSLIQLNKERQERDNISVITIRTF